MHRDQVGIIIGGTGVATYYQCVMRQYSYFQSLTLSIFPVRAIRGKDCNTDDYSGVGVCGRDCWLTTKSTRICSLLVIGTCNVYLFLILASQENRTRTRILRRSRVLVELSEKLLVFRLKTFPL